MNFDLCFVGTATTSFELCNFDTTRGHTPRILATSRVRPDRKAGSRCPHVPTDLRRWRGAASDVPMSPSARTLRCRLLGSTPAGMTSSRGPSREGRGLAPARRCPEHLLVTDFDHGAFGENVRELRSRSRFFTCDRFDPMHGRLPALLRVPRSDAPHVKSRGAFGTFGWRESRGSLQEDLLPPASVGFAGSC